MIRRPSKPSTAWNASGMPNDRRAVMQFLVKHGACPGEMKIVGTPVPFGLEAAVSCPGCGASISAIVDDQPVIDRVFELANAAGIVQTRDGLEVLMETAEGWNRLDAILHSREVHEAILRTLLAIERDEPKH
jgi:hypothetical protein